MSINALPAFQSGLAGYVTALERTETGAPSRLWNWNVMWQGIAFLSSLVARRLGSRAGKTRFLKSIFLVVSFF